MATARDPNKLEPAYLITLAVILGVPICCSYLTPAPEPKTATVKKLDVPDFGVWTTKISDNLTTATEIHTAIRDGKWRVESDQQPPLVVVCDGQTVANTAPLQSSQLKAMNPVTQLELVIHTFNRHPSPDSVLFDGVLCLHAKVRDGEDEAEAWIDAKTELPKKFIMTRGDRRAMTLDFDDYSPDIPSDPRIFDTKVLDPLLKK